MLKKTIISIFVIGVLGSATLVGLSIHNDADKTINFSNSSSHAPRPQQTTNSSIQAPKDLASTVQQTEQQAQVKAAQESARANQDQAIAAQDAINAQNIAAQDQANYNSAESQIQQEQANYKSTQQQMQQENAQYQQEQQQIQQEAQKNNTQSITSCMTSIPGSSQLQTLPQDITTLENQISNLSTTVQDQSNYSGATASQVNNNYNSQYTVLEQELTNDQNTYNSIESQVNTCMQ